MLTAQPSVAAEQVYLADFSPKDKPWDVHGSERDLIQNAYAQFNHPYAGRVSECSQLLEFAIKNATDSDELALRLQSTRFCRVRHCPVCQWRRQLKWRAKFFQVLPKIRSEHPSARFLFLTLTVRNCPVEGLSYELKDMHWSWDRLAKRKAFPALSWLRSVEITKSKDGTAHPHFHALLMVPGDYFAGRNYLSQVRWTELWQQAAKLDYTPIVHVRAVKAAIPGVPESESALNKTLCQTLKYSVKPSDIVHDPYWLVQLTEQLHKVRAVATGGVFKKYLAELEKEPDDLINVDEEQEEEDGDEYGRVHFKWKKDIKRYAM